MCEKNHPKKCRRYCRAGTNNKHGCKKGKDCEFFHPVLCKYSQVNRVCTNENCTFTHLQGTKRHAEQPADHEDGPHQQQRDQPKKPAPNPRGGQRPPNQPGKDAPKPDGDTQPKQHPEADRDAFLDKFLAEFKKAIDDRLTQIERRLPPPLTDMREFPRLMPTNYPTMMPVPSSARPSWF